jgi:hypothetical protein
MKYRPPRPGCRPPLCRRSPPRSPGGHRRQRRRVEGAPCVHLRVRLRALRNYLGVASLASPARAALRSHIFSARASAAALALARGGSLTPVSPSRSYRSQNVTRRSRKLNRPLADGDRSRQLRVMESNLRHFAVRMAPPRRSALSLPLCSWLPVVAGKTTQWINRR